MARPQLLVADAGPLIALAVAGVLPQALLGFGLLVPQAVLDECLADAYAPGADEIAQASRAGAFMLVPDAQIAPLDPAYAAGLGSGEIAVLAYAAQHQHVALVDERRARRVAQRLGVAVVGSGAVLLALKSMGLLAAIRPALVAWEAHGYHVAPALRGDLLARAGE
jgi:predicted nucleic acid-binding protein